MATILSTNVQRNFDTLGSAPEWATERVCFQLWLGTPQKIIGAVRHLMHLYVEKGYNADKIQEQIDIISKYEPTKELLISSTNPNDCRFVLVRAIHMMQAVQRLMSRLLGDTSAVWHSQDFVEEKRVLDNAMQQAGVGTCMALRLPYETYIIMAIVCRAKDYSMQQALLSGHAEELDMLSTISNFGIDRELLTFLSDFIGCCMRNEVIPTQDAKLAKGIVNSFFKGFLSTQKMCLDILCYKMGEDVTDGIVAIKNTWMGAEMHLRAVEVLLAQTLYAGDQDLLPSEDVARVQQSLRIKGTLTAPKRNADKIKDSDVVTTLQEHLMAGNYHKKVELTDKDIDNNPESFELLVEKPLVKINYAPFATPENSKIKIISGIQNYSSDDSNSSAHNKTEKFTIKDMFLKLFVEEGYTNFGIWAKGANDSKMKNIFKAVYREYFDGFPPVSTMRTILFNDVMFSPTPFQFLQEPRPDNVDFVEFSNGRDRYKDTWSKFFTTEGSEGIRHFSRILYFLAPEALEGNRVRFGAFEDAQEVAERFSLAQNEFIIEVDPAWGGHRNNFSLQIPGIAGKYTSTELAGLICRNFGVRLLTLLFETHRRDALFMALMTPPVHVRNPFETEICFIEATVYAIQIGSSVERLAYLGKLLWDSTVSAGHNSCLWLGKTDEYLANQSTAIGRHQDDVLCRLWDSSLRVGYSRRSRILPRGGRVTASGRDAILPDIWRIYDDQGVAAAITAIFELFYEDIIDDATFALAVATLSPETAQVRDLFNTIMSSPFNIDDHPQIVGALESLQNMPPDTFIWQSQFVGHSGGIFKGAGRNGAIVLCQNIGSATTEPVFCPLATKRPIITKLPGRELQRCEGERGDSNHLARNLKCLARSHCDPELSISPNGLSCKVSWKDTHVEFLGGSLLGTDIDERELLKHQKNIHPLFRGRPDVQKAYIAFEHRYFQRHGIYPHQAETPWKPFYTAEGIFVANDLDQVLDITTVEDTIVGAESFLCFFSDALRSFWIAERPLDPRTFESLYRFVVVSNPSLVKISNNHDSVGLMTLFRAQGKMRSRMPICGRAVSCGECWGNITPVDDYPTEMLGMMIHTPSCIGLAHLGREERGWVNQSIPRFKESFVGRNHMPHVAFRAHSCLNPKNCMQSGQDRPYFRNIFKPGVLSGNHFNQNITGPLPKFYQPNGVRCGWPSFQFWLNQLVEQVIKTQLLRNFAQEQTFNYSFLSALLGRLNTGVGNTDTWQFFLNFFGAAGCGKSVLSEHMCSFFPPSKIHNMLFLDKRFGAVHFANKSLIVQPEAPTENSGGGKDLALDPAQLKQAVTGEPMSSEVKYAGVDKFRVNAQILCIANGIPTSHLNADEGLKRRILVYWLLESASSTEKSQFPMDTVKENSPHSIAVYMQAYAWLFFRNKGNSPLTHVGVDLHGCRENKGVAIPDYVVQSKILFNDRVSARIPWFEDLLKESTKVELINLGKPNWDDLFQCDEGEEGPEDGMMRAILFVSGKRPTRVPALHVLLDAKGGYFKDIPHNENALSFEMNQLQGYQHNMTLKDDPYVDSENLYKNLDQFLEDCFIDHETNPWAQVNSCKCSLCCKIHGVEGDIFKLRKNKPERKVRDMLWRASQSDQQKIEKYRCWIQSATYREMIPDEQENPFKYGGEIHKRMFAFLSRTFVTSLDLEAHYENTKADGAPKLNLEDFERAASKSEYLVRFSKRGTAGPAGFLLTNLKVQAGLTRGEFPNPFS